MKYIRPSECELCVPLEVHDVSSGHAWSVDLAHQAECVNHPANIRKDATK
ncbi:hypothetical protein [Pseudarthrobacter sp. S9]